MTSPILLDQITPSGRLVNTLPVPALPGRGFSHQRDSSGGHMVTSFSSKSELALNLSTSGRDLTFMGYLAQPNQIDVSNSNTPAVIDPTNPVPGADYRVVAQVDPSGRFNFTETNAYSGGNNGRAAILNDSGGDNVYYLTGNAGNGGNPQPDGVITGGARKSRHPSTSQRVPSRSGRPSPSAASTSLSSGTRLTRSGRTPTSAA